MVVAHSFATLEKDIFFFNIFVVSFRFPQFQFPSLSRKGCIFINVPITAGMSCMYIVRLFGKLVFHLIWMSILSILSICLSVSVYLYIVFLSILSVMSVRVLSLSLQLLLHVFFIVCKSARWFFFGSKFSAKCQSFDSSRLIWSEWRSEK
jgi:hypothetical protein